MFNVIARTCLILVLGLAVTNASASIGPKKGQTAPDFTMTDLQKQSHSLSELRKDGHVLLVFWSTKCHVCHAMIPQFKQIHKQYGGKGLTFVAINVGFEDKDEVDDYVFEYMLDYLILNEDNKKAQIAQDYRLVGTPTIQLIAPDGTVKYRGHRIPDLETLLADSDKGQ
jgi:thiol-disulfide isomerase/thioredoxin